MAKIKPDKFSFGEMSGLFKENLNRAIQNPTIHNYVPHEKQTIFHSSTAREKLYIGGNRSGKTVGGTVEDIYWLTGKHPYRKTPPPPVKGRIVTVSYTEGMGLIIIPELKKWLPPSELINGSWEDSYNANERMLTLANGSSVELMSYDQKLEKFAGTSRHFTHFDEEPPKDIYRECKMRLLDTKGSLWITMTPVEGMSWVYDDIYLPGLDPKNERITVVSIDTSENPHIDEEELEDVIEGLDEAERKARKEGKFVQIGGLVFKKFDPKAHIIDPLDELQLEKIKEWTHYVSLDHGLNNPTAWLWHAVSPQGMVVTYDEIYANERLINSFAKEIHERNSWPGRRKPDLYVGDPAIKQRNAQTGDSVQLAYARAGIPIKLGNNDVHIGVNKMNSYLAEGKWVITGNCRMLIWELQRVRWKIYDTAKKRDDNNPREEIHKKNDHAPDSARYFFSLMPDLYIPKGTNRSELTPNEAVRQALSPVTPQLSGFVIDHNLRRTPTNTEWSHIDEHMGGLW